MTFPPVSDGGILSPRSRKRIIANLEAIYREAYDRAKAIGDDARMRDLDSSFQREQLILEVLLDVRDALTAGASSKGAGSALERLDSLRRLTKLK
jgi:hypothetical protein